jgi:CHAT domain-containing protein
LTQARAVPEAYSSAQPRLFSTIHFVTHADANQQSPLDSAIILSPSANRYRLYARDVAEIPLDADLVTISACRGAGARTLSGEGLVGFAWAFFEAGARNVVTSLWDVNDHSTAAFMGYFYAAVESGESYPAALRGAKLKLLRTQYRKPYYWAPFQLYSRMLSSTPQKTMPPEIPDTASIRHKRTASAP